jgi:hypothetical protein
VLVPFAIASTTVDSFGISDLDQVGWAMLDAFWPLSMLGIFGETVAGVVAIVHLLIGYTVLGQLVARKQS